MNEILIIENNAGVAETLLGDLRREGFAPVVAESGEMGWRLALDRNNPPLLILLDSPLSGSNGTELCRRLRREPLTKTVPIIMLAARATEAEKIAGLNVGADDVVVKPFSIKELLARVRAVLRRASRAER